MTPTLQDSPSLLQPSKQEVNPRSGLLQVSTTGFLIALSLLLITAAFFDEHRFGRLIEMCLTSVVMLSGIIAVSTRRLTVIIGTCLLTPALISSWIDQIYPNHIPHPLPPLLGMFCVGFVMFHLLRFVLLAKHVNFNVLSAAISGYLTLGLLCASLYALIFRLNSAAFTFTIAANPPPKMTGFTALYFSFVTLSTVGYGDIVPASNPARMVAMCEATAGLFYVALLISRLVSLYSADTKR